METKTFEITLRITVDLGLSEAPALWDWVNLLDLADNEVVEVLSQNTVAPVEN